MARAAGSRTVGRVLSLVVVGLVLAACGDEWDDSAGAPARTEAAPGGLEDTSDAPTTRQEIEVPLTTQPRVATTVPASTPPSGEPILTTVAPSTPAEQTTPRLDGPQGETAVVCGFVEPDPGVVPLAASCAQGYLLASFYRPTGASYGSRLWSLDEDVWVLRAKYDTGCPRGPELAAKGLPGPLATAWGSENGCRTDGEPFPYFDVLAVPRLGPESVRGSGCGADGSLGDGLPDGTWSVRVVRADGDSMDVDITCIYFGDEALDRSAAAGWPPTDTWFEVNGSDRVRPVRLSPRFQVRFATRGAGDSTCVDSGRPARLSDSTTWSEVPSWLVMRDGAAQLLLVTCPFA